MSSQAIQFPERPECAEHRARIVALELSLIDEKTLRRDLGDKLDNLKMWIMGTLAAAVASLAAQLMRR